MVRLKCYQEPTLAHRAFWAIANPASRGSPNQVEAITANFEKREPKFGDVG
jgi:hypothetical protein